LSFTQLVGMLNEVRIFKASLFISELDPNFTNSKLDTRNLSQGDSQGISFTARSYDLARPGVALPLVGGLSAVSFHLYSTADNANCAADYSVDIASRSCHAGPHIHAGVNIEQFYKNTAASLKPLSCVSSVQCVNFREDIAAAKRELLCASEH